MGMLLGEKVDSSLVNQSVSFWLTFHLRLALNSCLWSQMLVSHYILVSKKEYLGFVVVVVV